MDGKPTFSGRGLYSNQSLKTIPDCNNDFRGNSVVAMKTSSIINPTISPNNDNLVGSSVGRSSTFQDFSSRTYQLAKNAVKLHTEV